jgi:hypothetical protein
MTQSVRLRLLAKSVRQPAVFFFRKKTVLSASQISPSEHAFKRWDHRRYVVMENHTLLHLTSYYIHNFHILW